MSTAAQRQRARAVAAKQAAKAARVAAAAEAKATAGRQDFLNANYSYAAAVLAGSGQAGLFQQAVREAWTPDKFVAALQSTQWYKDRSKAQRDAEIQKASEPGQWKATVASHVALLRAAANKAGAVMDDAQLNQLAEQSVLGGWDDGAIQAAIGGHMGASQTGSLFGAAGDVEAGLRDIAAKNGVQYGDDFYRQAARDVISGTGVEKTWADSIRAQAMGQFPQWANEIKNGQNVRDMASPWIKSMASVLEIPEQQIRLDDPVLKQGLFGKIDAGQPMASPIWEFENQLRSDPRWAKTSSAQTTVANTASAVFKAWGLTS